MGENAKNNKKQHPKERLMAEHLNSLTRNRREKYELIFSLGRDQLKRKKKKGRGKESQATCT